MSRREFYQDPIGRSGVFPQRWILNTDDSLSTITATGYLNQFLSSYAISNGDFVEAKWSDNSGEFVIEKSGTDYTLQLDSSDVILPVTVNHMAVFASAEGAIGDDAATAINGGNIQAGFNTTAGFFASRSSNASGGDFRFKAIANGGNFHADLSNAAVGQNTVWSLPDPGATTANVILSKSAAAQHITVSGLQVDAAAVVSGLTTGGFSGNFTAYPTDSGKGSFQFQATSNTGNTATVFTNAAMGQASTINVPDPGAPTANVLLDTGSANLITYGEMIPIANIKFEGAGAANWTYTRIGQSNYAWVHTVGADATILSIDITGWVRAAANKGFKLTSIDFIYAIGAAAVPLTNSFTLDLVNYVNNAAVTVTAIAVSSLTLPFAAQANPYVANRTITSPVFDNTADSKYVVEWTVSTDTTTIFNVRGLNVNFSQTIA